MRFLSGPESHAADFIGMGKWFLATVLIGILFFVWLLAIIVVS